MLADINSGLSDLATSTLSHHGPVIFGFQTAGIDEAHFEQH